MHPSQWNHLNNAPKQFRAKTYPELKELWQLKAAAESNKAIERTKEEALLMFRNDDKLNQALNRHSTDTFGTASGSGYYHMSDVKKMMINMLTKCDMEYVQFYFTVWHPQSKLWISVSDLK